MEILSNRKISLILKVCKLKTQHLLLRGLLHWGPPPPPLEFSREISNKYLLEILTLPSLSCVVYAHVQTPLSPYYL